MTALSRRGYAGAKSAAREAELVTGSTELLVAKSRVTGAIIRRYADIGVVGQRCEEL
jgi:hypothetical protein